MATTTAAAQRARAQPGHRFAERRAELADAALQTLAELGYARTSLREIAQNSGFSHGVLHYYFTDKVDLITHCVQQYKAQCVRRYDEIIAGSSTAEALCAGFADGLAATAGADASLHRLWYDLRSQSMFEPSFRAEILEIDGSLQRMIWRTVSRYAELRQAPPVVTAETAYPLFDGLFQRALLHHLAGDADALDLIRRQVLDLLPRLVADPG